MSDGQDLTVGLSGLGAPRTARGRATAYGPPPWHMAGRTIAVWFKLEDPAEARRHVPAPMQLDDDPTLVARFWDMTHDAGLGDQAVADNPALTRFREAVVIFPVRHEKGSGDFTTYMYSDDPTYTAFGREVMGWPVRAGTIHMTAPWPRPGLQPGVRLGARLERHGSALMRVDIALEKRATAAASLDLPRWLSIKLVPSIAGPGDSLVQLVQSGPERLVVDEVWDASASLEFGEGHNDELHHLRVREIVAAQYWSGVDLSVGYGTILRSSAAIS